MYITLMGFSFYTESYNTTVLSEMCISRLFISHCRISFCFCFLTAASQNNFSGLKLFRHYYFICMQVCICMYVCVFVCIYIYMGVYIYVCVGVYVQIHMYIFEGKNVYIYK